MSALGELFRSLPVVRTLTDTANDPLGDIAAQMEHEITNAVRSVVRPTPDQVLAQALDRTLDFRQVFSCKQTARLPDKDTRQFAHDMSPVIYIRSERH